MDLQVVPIESTGERPRIGEGTRRRKSSLGIRIQYIHIESPSLIVVGHLRTQDPGHTLAGHPVKCTKSRPFLAGR
jgi:hypothetical protein